METVLNSIPRDEYPFPFRSRVQLSGVAMNGAMFQVLFHRGHAMKENEDRQIV
jgi:hypothetical protein